jgi:hypothetical protein
MRAGDGVADVGDDAVAPPADLITKKAAAAQQGKSDGTVAGRSFTTRPSRSVTARTGS